MLERRTTAFISCRGLVESYGIFRDLLSKRAGEGTHGHQTHERALVTGATSGIGRAVAIRLAKRGAAVALLGRNAAAAHHVAAEVVAAGGVAHVALADVSDAEQVQAAVTRFVAEHGGIDTVVASAGIALTGHVTDCELADWDRLLATNLNGVFYLARYTIPELLKSRGTFTAISSDAGVQGACGYAAYCAPEARNQRPDQVPGAGLRQPRRTLQYRLSGFC